MGTPVDADQDLGALLAAAFLEHAERPALIDGDGEVWSYGRAAEAVARIAGGLRDLGVGPGDRVVLQARTSLPAVLCAWALWRLGAVLVPVDPGWPAYLLEPVLEQVAPALLLAMAGAPVAGALPAVIVADGQGRASAGFLEWLARSAQPPAPAPATGTAVGAILFTSGSTGQPKGVLLSRGALARSAELAAATFGLEADEVFLNLAELHAMSGLRNTCLAAAARGGAVLLAAPADRGNLFAIQTCLSRHGVSALGAGPTLVRMLLRSRERLRPEPWRALRRFLCTGGSLPAEEARAFRAWAGLPVLDYYGLTETTGLCIGHRAGDGEDGDGTLGRPVGAVIRILGADGAEGPVGVAGELLVAGPNLMLGYLGRPDLTAEVMTDGCFRTGDQARRLPDGRIQLLGRIRSCVKTASGDLLFPEEIEAALNGCPDLEDAAAVGLADEQLALCLVPRTGLADPQNLPARVHGFLLVRLGARRLPGAYHLVSHIPRLASGKIDRRRLGELAHDLSDPGLPER
jgi:acyl-coenzyme A synthetase/AMP-(fatty) acid ligase